MRRSAFQVITPAGARMTITVEVEIVGPTASTCRETGAANVMAGYLAGSIGIFQSDAEVTGFAIARVGVPADA